MIRTCTLLFSLWFEHKFGHSIFWNLFSSWQAHFDIRTRHDASINSPSFDIDKLVIGCCKSSTVAVPFRTSKQRIVPSTLAAIISAEFICTLAVLFGSCCPPARMVLTLSRKQSIVWIGSWLFDLQSQKWIILSYPPLAITFSPNSEDDILPLLPPVLLFAPQNLTQLTTPAWCPLNLRMYRPLATSQ